MGRSLGNSNMDSARASTPDIKVAGDPGRWLTVCKASSESQGWMKSTKAMDVEGGCLVQVTTEHRQHGVVVACAEAVVFVPGMWATSLLADDGQQP